MSRASLSGGPAQPSSGPSDVLLGVTEPRVFTKPLRELTPLTSLGFDVIAFANNDLGITLHPYQEWLYIHALELLPSGEFRFDTIIVLIARQNGKTMWWKILILYVMYVLGMKLVLSTAQDLDTAEETWEAVVQMVQGVDDDDVPLFPELAEQVEKIVLTNGKKSLNLKSGERYKAKAASRRAGRGLSGDLIGLDELREQQSWDSWSAITHTTMARARSLIIGLSNAGDATSVVLRYLRKAGHATLGDPDGVNAADDPSAMLEDVDEVEEIEESGLGIFEWSAVPGASIKDRQGWAQANPSMNHPNGVGERKILAATKEPEWVFRTEVLCQWSDGSLEGPFPSGSWDAGWDKSSPIVGPVKCCVDVSANSERSHIAFSGLRADGRLHVELVASRPGYDWVGPWLLQRLNIISEVGAAEKGAPVSPLLGGWELAGIPVVRRTLDDVRAGTQAFYRLVCESKTKDGEPPAGLTHHPSPLLDVAAATAATRPSGDGLWVWDRHKSPIDASPLIAADGAVAMWGVLPELPTVSVYESRGLVVL